MKTTSESLEQLANLEAERLVIGSLFKTGDPEAFGLASKIISEASFAGREHRLVFSAMQEVFEAGGQINYGTVGLVLQKRDHLRSIGSLVELTSGLPGLANLESFCEVVAESERLRKMWMLSESIQEQIRTGSSCDQVIDDIQDKLFNSQAGRKRQNLVRPSEIIEKAGGVNLFITPSSDGKIATPWPRLNKRTAGGMRRRQVWTVGALSGSGKSSFAMQLVAHAIEHQHKRVKIIALEMGKEDVLHNLVCSRAGVDNQLASTGELTPYQRLQLSDSAAFFAETVDDLLEIEDEDCHTVPAITASLRKAKAEGREIDLLVIDFVQLLSGVGRFSSRREEVDQIAYGVKKKIATPFDIPVLNLVQLNVRKLDKDNPGPPSLGDFRESAAIEQSSDVGIILRRTDVEQQFREIQLMDAFVLKQRRGRNGKIPFRFHAVTRQFEEIPEHRQERAA